MSEVPPVILWNGISSISRPNDPTFQGLQKWIDQLYNNDCPLYIHFFNIKYTENQKENHDIVLSFMYFTNDAPFLFILHTSKEYSQLLFINEPFIQLRRILENRNRIKIVLSKMDAQNAFNKFKDFFKIAIHPFKCALNDFEVWTEYIMRENTQKVIIEEVSKFRNQVNLESVKHSLMDLSITMKNSIFMSLEEKTLSIALSKIILAVMKYRLGSST